MSGERLELVTDFASLRAGDLVVVKPCARLGCWQTHRGILLRCERKYVSSPDGVRSLELAWNAAPLLPCFPNWVICANAVSERRIFRVIIPPATEERETARPKKLERVE